MKLGAGPQPDGVHPMASMTRRSIFVLSGVLGTALALGVLWAQPRVAWEIAHAVALSQHRSGGAIDFAALSHPLEKYLLSEPRPKHARNALRAYFSVLEKTGATQSDLQALSSHPNRQISDMARAKLRRFALMSRPVELRFVALDGRLIDLRELRGRVVLLDFWASWCPTCMRELPHLKELYARYQGRGFEIVGVALDAAEDRPKLLALLQKQELSWPQYFPGDGHYATSELSQRFGVIGVPTTFLLDMQGMIAHTNLRGEALESEIRRLLAFETISAS